MSAHRRRRLDGTVQACLGTLDNLRHPISHFIFLSQPASESERETAERNAQPATRGTVEMAAAKMVGEGRTGYWVGELNYSYSVDGDYYAGSLQMPAASEDKASEMAKRWRDRAVIVRYLPENPEKSVLVLEEQDADSQSA
jgi:hypothetical protein